jgi:hypothetical protein
VLTRGFVAQKGVDIARLVSQDVDDQLGKLLADGMRKKDLAPLLKRNLRNTIFRITRRNPIVELQIVEV